MKVKPLLNAIWKMNYPRFIELRKCWIFQIAYVTYWKKVFQNLKIVNIYKHWYSPIFIPLYIWLFNKNWCANFAVIWGILSENSLWMKTLLSNLLLTRYYFIFTRGERIFSGPYPISVGERHLEKIRQDSVFADRPMIIYINCWLFSILFDCVFREIEYKFSE